MYRFFEGNCVLNYLLNGAGARLCVYQIFRGIFWFLLVFDPVEILLHCEIISSLFVANNVFQKRKSFWEPLSQNTCSTRSPIYTRLISFCLACKFLKQLIRDILRNRSEITNPHHLTIKRCLRSFYFYQFSGWAPYRNHLEVIYFLIGQELTLVNILRNKIEDFNMAGVHFFLLRHIINIY